jgi:hypothetical protein
MKVVWHCTALFAIAAVLVLTTISVLPAHGHDTARSCDICNSAHLPCLRPSAAIQLSPLRPVVWLLTTENFEHRLDCASIRRRPRAPPV